MDIKEKVKLAEESTNTNPTQNQREKGNYKKGSFITKGLKITIENPIGSIREGVDRNGKLWTSKLPFSYGYFNSTIGKDGDQIDVYLGPSIEDEFDVYVIDQIDEQTKAFDEHKVMFGFENEDQAKQAYLDCYTENWQGFGKINTFSLSKFKKWIKNKDALKYPASKLNMTSKIDYKNQVGESELGIIRMFGEVKEGETLLDLQKQAKELGSFSKLVLEIASPGGSVSEGLEIMVWLDMLSQTGVEVITVVTANAYSIASLIMLASDMRLISKHGKVMVHNPMLPELQYVNANDLEKHIASLRELEEMMYQLYETFTGLDREKIKSLMDSETYLLPKEAVDFGFADMVVDIKPKSYEMATNIKNEINMNKTLNILHRVISKVNQTEFVNQVYYSDSGEVEIFQNDPSTYSKGDRTSLEEGVVKLSDGSKLTIEDYVIVEIDKAVELEPELDEDGNPMMPMENTDESKIDEDGSPIVENTDEPKLDEDGNPIAGEFNEGSAPDTPVTPVKAKDDMPGKVVETTESVKTTKEVVATQITSISKWESEVVNDTFELETEVKYVADDYNPEPYSVGAGEWQLDDGRTVLTDSDGVIRFIKEAIKPVAPEAKAEGEDFQAKLDEAVSKIEKEIEAKFEAKFEALKEQMKSDDEEVKMKIDELNKFEELATEAIDTLASNTVSVFKPSAISKVEPARKGSLFAQMKAKAAAARNA